MIRSNVSNLLLIAGTGRNVGKTTLACQLIQKFAGKFDITGIKISPHFYQTGKNTKIIVRNKNYVLMEETNKLSDKDSARMLKAGASNVYFVQAADFYLRKVMEDVLHIVGYEKPIVCESGGLIKFVRPGIFLMLGRHDVSQKKKSVYHYEMLTDRWLSFDGKEFDINLNRIKFSDNSWQLNTC